MRTAEFGIVMDWVRDTDSDVSFDGGRRRLCCREAIRTRSQRQQRQRGFRGAAGCCTGVHGPSEGLPITFKISSTGPNTAGFVIGTMSFELSVLRQL